MVPRTFGCIENITVHPSYQGKGIGKDLMAQAHKWAAALGAETIKLTVWELNQKAFDMNKQLGNKTVHQRMIKDLTR